MSASNHKFIIEAGVTGQAQVNTLKQSIDNVAGSANQFVSEHTRGITLLQNAWAKLAGAAGLYKFVDMMGQAVAAASNLQEVSSKFDVVFKGQEQSANRWAKVLVESYAMSTREAKEYMGSLQDLLKPMGVVPSVAAKMSFEISKLSADLGSFNNQSTAKVMADIQSALVGNYETMKKYGVVVNESAVKQEGLNMGLIKGKEEMDAARKAAAAYSLILKGTADAQGDQQRTMDSYANQLKNYKTGVEDLKAVVGEAMIPALAELFDWLTKLAKAWKDAFAPDMSQMVMEKMTGDLHAMQLELAKFEGVAANKASPAVDAALGWLPGYITQEEAQDGIRTLKARIKTLNQTIETEYAKMAAEHDQRIKATGKSDPLKFTENSFEHAAKAGKDAAAEAKELKEYIDHVNNALENLIKQAENMGQAFQDGHWEAQEAAEKHKQALRDLYAEGMESEADALDALQQEVDKGIEQSVKSLTEINVKEYERFYERVKDLSADFIYEVMDGQVEGWEDMLDRVHDLFLRTFAELAAEMIAKPILVPIVSSMAGSMGLNVPAGISGAGNLLSGSGGLSNALGLGGSSGLFSGFLGGNTAATLAEGELLGGVVASSGLGMSSVSAALPYVGPAILGWEALGGMFGLPTPSSLLGGLFGGGEKTPKLELGAGSQVQMGRPHVTTPFGLLGIDMASAIDTDQFKPLMDSIKSVTTLMADTMSDAMVASVTDAMSNWSSDKLRGEGIDAEDLFVDYFRAIGAAWNTEFGTWIADFDGSLDDLMSGIQAHLSVMNQIESIIDPNGYAIKSINQQFDAMRETLEETGGSAAEFSKLERARNITLQQEQASQYAAQMQQWEAEIRASEQAAAAHQALIDRIMEANISTNQYGGSLSDLDIAIYQIDQQFAKFTDDLKEAGLWAKYASEWEERLTEAKRQAVAAAKLADQQAILGLPGVNQAGIIQGAVSDRFGMDLSQVTVDWARSVMEWVGTIDSMAELQPVLDALDMDLGEFQTWIGMVSTGLGIFDQAIEDTAAAAATAAQNFKNANMSASYGAGSAAGAPLWQQAFHYFQNQHGISWDLKSAKQWYGAYQENWMNKDLVNEVAAGWGMTPQELYDEFGLLGAAIRDYEASLQKTTGAVADFGAATNDAAQTFQNAIGSIDDLILRLTGGDLAPVQSAEFFTGQYAKLLGAARQNPENAAAFTGFVPEMLQWMGGYGMDYKELASNTVSDLQGLKASYQKQSLTVNVNVLMDGRVIGTTVVNQTYTHPDLINRLNEIVETRVSVGN